jgi:hypothetical protein
LEGFRGKIVYLQSSKTVFCSLEPDEIQHNSSNRPEQSIDNIVYLPDVTPPQNHKHGRKRKDPNSQVRFPKQMKLRTTGYASKAYNP